MEDHTVLVAVIAALQVIGVAVIGGLFNRESKKHTAENNRVDKQIKTRIKEGRLSMKLMSANTGLAVATSIAVKEGKVNGEMEQAMNTARQAQRDYYDFINEIASEQMEAE
jgi:hypothetical protein